jgi:large subunit ribosomal protein L49
VYHLAKRGGNKKLTTVKKVEGDRAKFRAALAAALNLKEKEVVINSVTGHIIVPVSSSALFVFLRKRRQVTDILGQGHRKAEVQKWLADQGF